MTFVIAMLILTFASRSRDNAVLAHGKAETQPFIDGNKRTAYFACLNFLDVNGYALDAPSGATFEAQATVTIHATQGAAMAEKHSRPTSGGRAVWYTERLWGLARDLPVRTVAVADIPELDRDCWFGSSYVPTCRVVAEHARRIWEADLSYPIILSADGGLMDGGHRLAKAWLLGLPEVQAVQFTVDPEPDYVIPDDALF